MNKLLKRIPLLLWFSMSVSAAVLSLMALREHRLFVAELAIQDLTTIGAKASASDRTATVARALVACQRLTPFQSGLFGAGHDYVSTGCKNVRLDSAVGQHG